MSVQGWEKGLCSGWVSTVFRCIAAKAMFGEVLCLSIRLCRSLWRNCSAVSQERMGRQGRVIPKTGCVLSVAEKGSQVARDLR